MNKWRVTFVVVAATAVVAYGQLTIKNSDGVNRFILSQAGDVTIPALGGSGSDVMVLVDNNGLLKKGSAPSGPDGVVNSASFTGTTTKTLTLTRTQSLPDLTTSFTDYHLTNVTSSGTTEKTLTFTRNGLSNLTLNLNEEQDIAHVLGKGNNAGNQDIVNVKQIITGREDHSGYDTFYGGLVLYGNRDNAQNEQKSCIYSRETTTNTVAAFGALNNSARLWSNKNALILLDYDNDEQDEVLRVVTNAPNAEVPGAIELLRLHENYYFRLGSGAYCSTAGVWTNASSREYKENITTIGDQEAMECLKNLNPIRYNHKNNPSERYNGFIAEDVPDLVARKDRKALSPMDIVAVAVKVIQLQEQRISALEAKLAELQGKSF